MPTRYALSTILFLMGTYAACASVTLKSQNFADFDPILQQIYTRYGDAGRALVKLIIKCVQTEAPHTTYTYEDAHKQFIIHHNGALIYQGSWGSRKEWNLIVDQRLSDVKTTVLEFKPIEYTKKSPFDTLTLSSRKKY